LRTSKSEGRIAAKSGQAAFDAALRGENGGFAGGTFQRSGELFKQLVDLRPFQNGFLDFKNGRRLFR
jgi:hypothetical protein